MSGWMLSPGGAPMKIDVWRRVRHPPPDFVHAYTVKSVQDNNEAPSVGHPATLPGKMISWVWLCDGLDMTEADRWHVRVDVRQDGISVPGFPADYRGVAPPGQPLAQLRIAEVFDD